MKPYVFTPHRRLLALPLLGAVFGAAAMLIAPLSAFAQSKTVSGDFQSSDGNSGTYTRTIDVSGNTTIDSVVYTRSADGETATATTTTVKDTADKSRTVSYSFTDYGATSSFVSNKTVQKVKGGHTATGTYTSATGVSGTLTTLETSFGDASIVSTEYTNSSGAITHDLSAEFSELGFVVVKHSSEAPDGTVTAVITTRYITS